MTDSTQPEKPQHGTPPPTGRVLQPPYTEAQGAHAKPVAAAAELLPAHLLDGGEIVILAVKPSLWFVVFKSARWLFAMTALILLAGRIAEYVPYMTEMMIMQTAMALAVTRVAFAGLQWASRLYVLTNRRIMRMAGIVNIDLFECPLSKIQNTYLTLAWYERLIGLGTIAFATAGTGGVEASWRHVNNPLEMHERVRSAIHRASNGGHAMQP